MEQLKQPRVARLTGQDCCQAPTERNARAAETAITWNYTTVLNIIFLLLAAALLVRFFRTGSGPCSR
jgi:hypothetical protein